MGSEGKKTTTGQLLSHYKKTLCFYPAITANAYVLSSP